MSTNISKQKRDALLDKIQQIKKFISAGPQDENTANLLTYIGELTKEINGKKYGLVFEEHREKIDELLEENAPVLVEQEDLFIDNGGEMNFLIEGDNLAALKLLEKTHKGKIDVIYIDPPYNTGDEDFIYDDNYVDKEDVFRHSKWLSFMEKRLEVAKLLLKNDGIVFISIDDNEQSQLKILCDEIFGETNFIDNLMVEMSNTGGMKVGAAKKGSITKNGEFILIYQKSEFAKENQRCPLFDFVPGFDTHFNLFLDDSGTVKKFSEVLGNQISIINELSHYGEKFKNNNISLQLINEYFDKSEIIKSFILENINKIVRPRNEIPNIPDEVQLEKGKWITYKSDKRDEKYYLTLTEKDETIQLVPMSYNYRKTDDFNSKYGRSVIRGDYWKGFWLDMGNISKEGSVEFKNGKKPTRLIFQLLKWSIYNNPSSTILDFFAGSGTTGHAVMKLNAEDGGNRKFILCTNNENNICQDVTYQRLKTVITGKRKDGSDYDENYKASLKYFKIDYLPIKDKMYYEYADELLEHVKELVELENAIDFNTNKSVAIVLDDDELDDFVENIADYPECKTLYMGHDVLTSYQQEQTIKAHGITINTVPDYYYRDLAN